MKAKVLVGCPTSEHKEYCLNEYINAVKGLSYDNYDILLVDNSETDRYCNKIKSLGINVIKDKYLERARDRIVNSRNIIREYALNNGYDYFLSLEQDVIPPKDIIERLLRHEKDIVSGVYFTKYFINGAFEIKPLLWVNKEGFVSLQFIDDDSVKKEKLIRVDACGLGCILIKKDILEKVRFRLFPDKSTFDDMPFCKDLNDKKIQIYSDTSIKCKHLISGMDWEKIKE